MRGPGLLRNHNDNNPLPTPKQATRPTPEMVAPLRSQQRFQNFKKVFLRLEKYGHQQSLNELEEQGLIQSFEYTYELAWKTLQDILQERGHTEVAGPRPVIEQAFKDGLVQDGEGWMRMFSDRNSASHIYDEQKAREILANIRKEYVGLFRALMGKLSPPY